MGEARCQITRSNIELLDVPRATWQGWSPMIEELDGMSVRDAVEDRRATRAVAIGDDLVSPEERARRLRDLLLSQGK